MNVSVQCLYCGTEVIPRAQRWIDKNYAATGQEYKGSMCWCTVGVTADSDTVLKREGKS